MSVFDCIKDLNKNKSEIQNVIFDLGVRFYRRLHHLNCVEQNFQNRNYKIKDNVNYKHDQVYAENDLLSRPIYLIVFFVISAEEGHSMIPAKPVSIPEGCTKGQ